MKVVGDRVSILKKDNLLSVVILPGLDRKRLFVIFLWLLAWSVCGIIVLINYFQLINKDQKLFVMIFLSFWAYFEFTVIRAFIWKRSGKEKFWIQDGIAHYQHAVNNKGKIKEYDATLMSRVEIVELRHTRLADTLNQSFWVKGGERLEFTCQGRTIRFGMQLTEHEARVIRQEINTFLK